MKNVTVRKFAAPVLLAGLLAGSLCCSRAHAQDTTAVTLTVPAQADDSSEETDGMGGRDGLGSVPASDWVAMLSAGSMLLVFSCIKVRRSPEEPVLTTRG